MVRGKIAVIAFLASGKNRIPQREPGRGTVSAAQSLWGASTYSVAISENEVGSTRTRASLSVCWTETRYQPECCVLQRSSARSENYQWFFKASRARKGRGNRGHAET